MAKYLKLFETSAEYQQFIGGDFLRPNVSLVKDTNSLSFYPLEKELPYLTMTALEDDLTVSLSETCQYSLNGTDWVELQVGEQTPAINTGEKFYFKNTGVYAGQFTVSKRFNLSGNIMSMIFGDEAEGKTDLTGYPECFMGMFNSCTGLVSVSKNFLPATTLTESCYNGMFEGCTSLVNAPELPATTLADYCYMDMFAGCTLLVTAPELPAAQLANSCYSGMFNSCTSLVNAPELPATTLVNDCYITMFYGCTSLNHIKMLATDISANYCLGSWVNNVSPTGTFVKSKDATWNVTGESGIPEGWTVETV